MNIACDDLVKQFPHNPALLRWAEHYQTIEYNNLLLAMENYNSGIKDLNIEIMNERIQDRLKKARDVFLNELDILEKELDNEIYANRSKRAVDL